MGKEGWTKSECEKKREGAVRASEPLIKETHRRERKTMRRHDEKRGTVNLSKTESLGKAGYEINYGERLVNWHFIKRMRWAS